MKISVLLAALLLLFSCTDKDSKQSQDLIVKTAQAVSASGIKTTEFPFIAVSYTHLRAHETEADLVCRLLLEKIFF